MVCDAVVLRSMVDKYKYVFSLAPLAVFAGGAYVFLVYPCPHFEICIVLQGYILLELPYRCKILDLHLEV